MVKLVINERGNEVIELESGKRGKAKVNKRPWSYEEDQLLIRLISELGPHRWTSIACKIPQRLGKQCRERWFNHLNPQISKQEWSEK